MPPIASPNTDQIRALVGSTGPVELDGFVLHCACCGLPWARIRGGELIVASRHHGEQHINAIALTEIKLSSGTTALNG